MLAHPDEYGWSLWLWEGGLQRDGRVGQSSPFRVAPSPRTRKFLVAPRSLQPTLVVGSMVARPPDPVLTLVISARFSRLPAVFAP